MATYDPNYNAASEWREVLKASSRGSRVHVPYTEAQLKGMFRRFDSNGDALLNRKDLENAVSELGSKFPAWRALRAFCNAHENRHGYIKLDHDRELENLVKYTLRRGYSIH